MSHSSWLMLERQDPRYVLPADLRDRDAFAARDVGWVEQMRPFITAFTQPGDLVLDPFAGFGTTLVAAALEKRRGLGIEIDATRAEKIIERAKRLALPAPDIRVGDCASLAATLPAVDLVLTSVPYFGCQIGLEGDAGQRYGDPDYAVWLERMRLTFKSLERVLRPGGYLIAMAENLRIGPHFVPQAWDLARVLAERFVMQDERVIVYPRAAENAGDPSITNRSHEYALVARQVSRAVDLPVTLEKVRALARDHRLIVYGSLAGHVRGGERAPSDADLLLHPDIDVVTLVRSLEGDGYRITRWGEPAAAAAARAALRTGFYLLAEKLDRQGRLCRIDLTLAESADAFERRAAAADVIDGVRFER